MEKNMISIIIPVYNGENYIAKCMESVIFQTYKDIEIIVIDDGSLDKTGDICKKYCYDNRVQYYRIDNHGPAYARNYGISLSKGEWIMFVDSDDIIDCNICMKLIEKIWEYTADLAFCTLKNVFEDDKEQIFYPFGRELSIYNGQQMKSIEKALVSKVSETGDSMISLSGPYCKLIKKEIAINALFPEKLSLGEDTCFVLQCIRQCKKAVYLPEALYHRNVISGSLSNDCKDEDIRLVKYTNWIDEYYKNDWEMRAFVNDLFGHNLRKILYDYLSPIGQNSPIRNLFHVKYYVKYQKRKLTCREIIHLRTSKKAKVILLLAKFRLYFLVIAIYKLKGQAN